MDAVAVLTALQFLRLDMRRTPGIYSDLVHFRPVRRRLEIHRRDSIGEFRLGGGLRLGRGVARFAEIGNLVFLGRQHVEVTLCQIAIFGHAGEIGPQPLLVLADPDQRVIDLGQLRLDVGQLAALVGDLGERACGLGVVGALAVAIAATSASGLMSAIAAQRIAEKRASWVMIEPLLPNALKCEGIPTFLWQCWKQSIAISHQVN